jgi:hypothetical protein
MNVIAILTLLFKEKLPRWHLGYSTVVTEAVHASEMSVHFYVTARRYIPGSCRLHVGCRENPKSHLKLFTFLCVLYDSPRISQYSGLHCDLKALLA